MPKIGLKKQAYETHSINKAAAGNEVEKAKTKPSHVSVDLSNVKKNGKRLQESDMCCLSGSSYQQPKIIVAKEEEEQRLCCSIFGFGTFKIHIHTHLIKM